MKMPRQGVPINEPVLSSSVKNTPIWMITFSKKQGLVFPELWEADLSGTKQIARREWMMTGSHGITRLLSYCSSRRHLKLLGSNTLVPHISIGPFDTYTQHKQKLNQMTALYTHTRTIKQQTWVWRQDFFFFPMNKRWFLANETASSTWESGSCPNRSAYLCKITSYVYPARKISLWKLISPHINSLYSQLLSGRTNLKKKCQNLKPVCEAAATHWIAWTTMDTTAQPSSSDELKMFCAWTWWWS